MNEPSFTFIEAPIYQGQKHFGVSLGPSFIRQCLLDQNFEFTNLNALARQNLKKINLKPYEELSYLVEAEVQKNNLVFTAGGDHSLALGSIQGLLRNNPDLKVIWVDAHGDINTRSSSVTGSFHGMPLSFLTGADQFENEPWFETLLKPENLIYFGVRDLDFQERIFLDTNNIMHFSTSDIKTRGLEYVVSEIVAKVSGSQVHLSVDSDAFDPTIAPSTGVPVADGLSYSSVSHLVREVLRVSEVKSYDYVELNPQIFQNPQDVFYTAQIGIDLFSMILENYTKRREIGYGRYDRQRHSTEPDLLHTYF